MMRSIILLAQPKKTMRGRKWDVTHPEYSPDDISREPGEDHHDAAQNQHQEQGALDQYFGDAHHDGERRARQDDRDGSQNEGGVYVSRVIVTAVVDARGEGGGAVDSGHGDYGGHVGVEEEGEDRIAAFRGLGGDDF